MSELQIKEGDRVRHRSNATAPVMVVIRVDEKQEKRELTCQYWDEYTHDFKYGTFFEFELKGIE